MFFSWSTMIRGETLMKCAASCHLLSAACDLTNYKRQNGVCNEELTCRLRLSLKGQFVKITSFQSLPWQLLAFSLREEICHEGTFRVGIYRHHDHGPYLLAFLGLAELGYQPQG